MRRSFVILLAAFLALSALLPAAASSATVRDLRDTYSIPHIFGSTDRDVLYALGRAHARDRFFQMDVLRHTFSGTLAEMVGTAGLASDVQLRTLGLRRAAEASLPAISRETRVWLDAYARGVNSYILDPGNPLPVEYAPLELTRASIHPWTALDSLTIGKGLAFGLSFDLGDIDLTTALTAFQTAGPAGGFDGALLFSDVYRFAPFDPTHSLPASGPLPGPGGPVEGDKRVSSLPVSPRTASLAARYREKAARVPLLRDALERRQSGRGSNWWVAAGKVTDSGRPILANDPHLSLGNPATFYEAQLRITGGGRPAMNAFGVTFPGIPAIVLGCNPRICWGATTNPMDVTDVYQERLVLDPASGLPNATVFDGKPEPLVAIPQTYLVNQMGNGTADDLVNGGIGPLDGGVTLVVPRRNRGPIVAVDLSDPTNPIGLSVQYTGWGATRELDAFRTWSRAASLDEFKQGLQFFDFGSQNWAYADVDGNIAYFTSGELPLREDLQTLGAPDGGIPPFLIRDGTHTLRHEWLPAGSTSGQEREPGQAIPYQILPFAEMPQTVNPIRGYIANANNDPLGTSNDNDPLDQRRHDGGILYLGVGYDRGYRIGRIERLLEGELKRDGSFSVQDFERFQANNQLLDAEVLTPYLLAAFDNARAAGAPAPLAALAADPRIAEAVARLRAWDFSTPTGIPEGWDPGDPPVANPAALPAPSAREIGNSVAATIYSVWRGQAVARIIDAALQGLGLGGYVPPGDVALADLRHLLETFPESQGRGASGIDFFAVAGAPSPESARDLALLQSLQSALDLLAGDPFAPAFNHSANQEDYRWGRLHRIVFDHPLGGPFDLPPSGGFPDLAPGLPGLARAGGFGTVDAAAHDVRAASANAFMFGSGPARRFVGTLQPSGPVCEEVIPGGERSGLPDQLPLWLTNHYHPWLYRPADVIRGTVAGEVIVP
ncbi:MAG TPA: penicillin acylase family protein [Thermoanaerobaculia bacterium]|nr:penicillin acylase family protein [Thermoanaerobaculia bacterium]